MNQEKTFAINPVIIDNALLGSRKHIMLNLKISKGTNL